jgi:alcohol dehydrogenase
VLRLKDFVFHNPVKVVFGRDAHQKLGKEASTYGKKALVLIGMGSVKRTGLYSKVIDVLHGAEIETVTVEAVRANPVLSKVNEAIGIARESNVDMIIAIGGGSVIDSAKAVAAGIPYEGDVWDFFINKARAKKAVPLFAVLTLAATASEMNRAAVITNEETKEKFSFGSPHTFPIASFLDPSVTFSVPADQSAYGGVDAITHLLEPYFNNGNTNSSVQDNMTEGMIRSIMAATDAILKNPNDYDARASMMWSASLALNGLTQAGMGSTPFPLHMIEHSLSAIYDIAHAAGLALLLPGWLSFKLPELQARIAQLGRNVFAIKTDDDLSAAQETIEKFKEWYTAIGCPVSLKDAGISADDVPAIAENAVRLAKIWSMPEYDQKTIEQVLRHCSN